MSSPKSALSADRPFVGLRPYCFEDQEFFFGRGDQIFSLYRLLDHSRFVSVVGSSGSGKSSLVRAGLLPLLDRESHEPTGRAWKILQMHSGDYPTGSLATSIAQQLSPNDPPNITAARRERIRFALGRSSFGLADALREFGGAHAASVVLVVDQFEELFRYTGRRSWPEKPEAAKRQEEATQFVQLLLAASRERALNVYILLTMRSDFIGECAAFGGLPEAVSAAQFLVPALTRDQLEQAIRGPIEKARARIEPALVERLLNESGDDIDQLPVLQHCLARLWEQARCDRQDGAGGRCLTVQHYLQVGGMARALSRHADKLLGELPEKKLAAEQIFRSLAEIDGEGRIVRRARLFNELVAETGVPTQDLRRVVDRFRDDDNSFLTPAKSEICELTAATRIDVGHEALLRRWERVSGDWRKGSLDVGWVLAEERDGRIYRGLLAMAEAGAKIGSARFEERWQWWKERPRTAEWAKRYGGNIEEVERLFSDSLAELRAEAARKDAEQAAERRRVELEAEAARARDEAEKTRLELAAQTARERELNALRFARMARRFAIGVTGLLCFTIALGVATYVQRQAALQQKQNAEQSLTIGGDLTSALLAQVQNFLDNGRVSVGAVTPLLKIAREHLAKLERIEQTPATLAARSSLLLAFADLSMALQDSKSALRYSQQALSLATQLVAGDPGNDANQRLLYSADFRIGDAHLSNFDGALHAYNEALAIVQDLAAKEPANYVWMQDAAFVTNKIADIWKIKGNNEEVLKQYQTALSIDEKLAQDNPRVEGLQRDLATTLTRIGDLQDEEGDFTAALTNYQNALSIRKELAGRNPDDASIQSNLSVAYNAVADVLVKQQKFEDAAPLFNEALKIRNNLADGDSTNTLWQNYLAHEYVYIGNMLSAKRDFSGAIKNYHQSLNIRNRLTGRDPNNFTWLKNLADIHTRLAEALYTSGDSTSALNEHKAALAFRVKIGAHYSDSLTRQRELIAEYIAIADVVAQQGDSAGAVVNYQSAGGVIAAFLGRHPSVKSLDPIREVVAEKIRLLGPSQAASP